MRRETYKQPMVGVVFLHPFEHKEGFAGQLKSIFFRKPPKKESFRKKGNLATTALLSPSDSHRHATGG